MMSKNNSEIRIGEFSGSVLSLAEKYYCRVMHAGYDR